MDDVTKLTISRNAELKEVIAVLDKNGQHIALVIDDDGRLAGAITDGDIRRAILKGVALDAPAHAVMNTSPRTSGPGLGRKDLMKVMTENRIDQIPIVDDDGKVLRLETMYHLAQKNLEGRRNWVVLMAGGLGTRLRPLTEDVPKPLLEVGDKPILEQIVMHCAAQDFKRFYISVNYKAEMIMDHFGDGSDFGVEIRYVHEKQRMGTAGSLSLLPNEADAPLVVMNADLLTKVDLGKMLNYHSHHDAKATMAVREYDFQVPFGVVQTEDHQVVSIDEKPVHKFFVNAGIYILDHELLQYVQSGVYMDMPDLLNKVVSDGINTTAFPIIERWIDIGRIEDFKRAQEEF